MIKYISSIILFIAIGFSSFAQTFEAEINHNEIKIGEQAELEFRLGFAAGTKDIMLPVLKDTISKFIEIVEVSNIDTTFDEDDITQKFFTQKIIVTSWDSGIHVIPPFKAIVNGQTLLSEPLLLKVNTIKIEAEKDLKDIKEIIEVPFSLWDWVLTNKIVIICILITLILLIVGIILYRRYKNKPEIEKEVFVPKEAADLVAIKKLDDLQTAKLWQGGNIKAYHSKLSFIVREYIENRFEVNALEQTTDEIKVMLKGNSLIAKEDLAKLYDLLLLADLAKFAKQQPIASENENALKTAYQFINKTKIVASENNDSNLTENGNA